MKKILLMGILIYMIGFGIKTVHATPINWISVDIATFGGGVRYERDINELFSIGGTIFAGGSLDFDYWRVGALATTRFFPVRFPIYLEIGLGGGLAEGTEDQRTYRVAGFMIAPSIGVRLDVGREGGFFINPFISLSTVIGEKRWQEYPKNNDGIIASSSFRIGFGLGWRF